MKPGLSFDQNQLFCVIRACAAFSSLLTGGSRISKKAKFNKESGGGKKFQGMGGKFFLLCNMKRTRRTPS